MAAISNLGLGLLGWVYFIRIPRTLPLIWKPSTTMSGYLSMTVWLCMCKLWSCNRLCVCVPATHTLWIISFFSLFFPRTLWQGPWFSFTNLEMSQWTLKVFLHYARSTRMVRLYSARYTLVTQERFTSWQSEKASHNSPCPHQWFACRLLQHSRTLCSPHWTPFSETPVNTESTRCTSLYCILHIYLMHHSNKRLRTDHPSFKTTMPKPFLHQFYSHPWPIGATGGGQHEGRFSRDPFPVFSAGSLCEQFWHEQGCPLFDVVHPAFPLPTTASFTL